MPLAGFVVEIIQGYRASRRQDCEWFFPSEALTPLDDRKLIRREVEPICAQLGIKRFSWHSLRHTFRTIAGSKGAAPELAQSILGHTNLEMTMRYMHRVDKAEKEAVEKVAEVLCPNVPKPEPVFAGGSKLIQ